MEEDDESKYAAQLEELKKARQAELQARAVAKQVLEPAAYERLANIRAANPELYAQLVQLFVYLAQNGQLKSRITEEQLKEFISRLLAKQRKETKITINRK
jgi:programmed cell death protein 5